MKRSRLSEERIIAVLKELAALGQGFFLRVVVDERWQEAEPNRFEHSYDHALPLEEPTPDRKCLSKSLQLCPLSQENTTTETTRPLISVSFVQNPTFRFLRPYSRPSLYSAAN